jgi:phage terminase Nu1 subunit (DNA packaging protein)
MAEINDGDSSDILSLSDFADKLGITDRTVRQHIKAGLPVVQRGARAGAVPWQISWPLACRWLIANAASNAAVAGETKEHADQRKAIAAADTAEINKETKALDLSVRRGQQGDAK